MGQAALAWVGRNSPGLGIIAPSRLGSLSSKHWHTGLARHAAESLNRQTRGRFIQSLRSPLPPTFYNNLLKPLYIPRARRCLNEAAAAFLRAADTALRPCALTQNNHAISFVAIAKNEGKVAMVAIMRNWRGLNSTAILQFLPLFIWTMRARSRMSSNVKTHTMWITLSFLTHAFEHSIAVYYKN